ncbi:uncharacterized protein LOC125536168 [Triticum urartu]|uniref:uncharacterized protein LOC125536168 n=1 Tax=Triticum urartu TaxID=4572 RepID=UPI002042E4BB|nr:uncharacterized protein LOC125536168 [Triticum urartu]
MVASSLLRYRRLTRAVRVRLYGIGDDMIVVPSFLLAAATLKPPPRDPPRSPSARSPLPPATEPILSIHITAALLCSFFCEHSRPRPPEHTCNAGLNPAVLVFSRGQPPRPASNLQQDDPEKQHPRQSKRVPKSGPLRRPLAGSGRPRLVEPHRSRRPVSATVCPLLAGVPCNISPPAVVLIHALKEPSEDLAARTRFLCFAPSRVLAGFALAGLPVAPSPCARDPCLVRVLFVKEKTNADHARGLRLLHERPLVGSRPSIASSLPDPPTHRSASPSAHWPNFRQRRVCEDPFDYVLDLRLPTVVLENVHLKVALAAQRLVQQDTINVVMNVYMQIVHKDYYAQE